MTGNELLLAIVVIFGVTAFMAFIADKIQGR